MAVVIDIIGTQATVQDYQWSCDDPDLLATLDSLKRPYGPSGDDPNPDQTLADRAVEVLGATIVSADVLEPGEPGRVY